jgi:hypothetical protein
MGMEPLTQIQSHDNSESLGSNNALPFPIGMSPVKSHQELQSVEENMVTVKVTYKPEPTIGK